MLGIFRTLKTRPLPKVTIFHNTNSVRSHEVLSKLNNFAELPCTYNRYSGNIAKMTSNITGKFGVDLRMNSLPTYDEYLLIYDFLSTHPDNAIAFEKVYPMIFQDETLCKKSASLLNKKQKYLGDLNVFTPEEYKKINEEYAKSIPSNNIKQNTYGATVFKAPLVVDWDNSLIAVDDKGLDRIMANYLTCGTQTTQGNNYKSFTKSSAFNHSHVHPHVAEFADLF